MRPAVPPSSTSVASASALVATAAGASWSIRPRSSSSCGTPGDDSRGALVLAKERQAPGGRRLTDPARNEEGVAALLERPRGGDQRAAAGRRLDDDRGVGHAGDDPVPAREGPRRRLDVGGELRHHRPAGPNDPVGEAACAAREQPGMAAADDRDRRAAGHQGGLVRLAVDADREARHDRCLDPREARRRSAPPAAARRRSGSRADHGDGTGRVERAPGRP